MLLAGLIISMLAVIVTVLYVMMMFAKLRNLHQAPTLDAFVHSEAELIEKHRFTWMFR